MSGFLNYEPKPGISAARKLRVVFLTSGSFSPERGEKKRGVPLRGKPKGKEGIGNAADLEKESASLLLYAERSEACTSEVMYYLYKVGFGALVLVMYYLYKGGKGVVWVNG